MTYVLAYCLYINAQFNMQNHENDTMYRPYIYIMLICNTWAMGYDLRQLIKAGWLYFYDPWNLVDWIYILSGYANLFIQYDWH